MSPVSFALRAWFTTKQHFPASGIQRKPHTNPDTTSLTTQAPNTPSSPSSGQGNTAPSPSFCRLHHDCSHWCFWFIDTTVNQRTAGWPPTAQGEMPCRSVWAGRKQRRKSTHLKGCRDANNGQVLLLNSLSCRQKAEAVVCSLHKAKTQQLSL